MTSQKTHDMSFVDFVLGYLLSAVSSSLVYLILRGSFAVIEAPPLVRSSLSDFDIFSFVLWLYLFNVTSAFILMLPLWSGVYYVGQKLACNNLLYFAFMGAALTFLANSFTGAFPLEFFPTGEPLPLFNRIATMVRHEGLVLLVMGMSFGVTFFYVTAFRRRASAHF